MRRPNTDDLPFDPDLGDGFPGQDRPVALSLQSAPKPRSGHWAVLAVVSAGGVLGGIARYGVEHTVPVGGDGFPWGTFVVNTVGAFVLAIGLVLMLEIWPPRRYLRPFVAIGFLGSFTTFSSWMLEVHDLAVTGRIGLAAAYLAGSLFAGLAAASLGLLVGRAGSRVRAGYRTAGTS